jgi:DNA-directed RNA polymerase subunit beta'
MSNGVQIAADVNYLYQDLMHNNLALNDIKKEFGDELGAEEKLNMYKSLKAVAGLGDPIHPKLKDQNVKGLLTHVFGKSSPKLGMFQRRVIGMATDVTGRSVISPNPKLDMDEVGLPEGQAWEIFTPFVIRRLTRRGMKAQDALKAIEDKTRPAKQALIEEMDRRPIVITRAPVLSKYGIMGAYPKLVKGHSLQISPIVTPGFVADFDGDTMSYHVPVSDQAIDEVKNKMMPSKNLKHISDFKVHYTPKQEYLYGLYLASKSSKNKKGPPRRFISAEAAKRAYRRGELNLDDDIVIGPN